MADRFVIRAILIYESTGRSWWLESYCEKSVIWAVPAQFEKTWAVNSRRINKHAHLQIRRICHPMLDADGVQRRMGTIRWRLLFHSEHILHSGTFRDSRRRRRSSEGRDRILPVGAYRACHPGLHVLPAILDLVFFVQTVRTRLPIGYQRGWGSPFKRLWNTQKGYQQAGRIHRGHFGDAFQEWLRPFLLLQIRKGTWIHDFSALHLHQAYVPCQRSHPVCDSQQIPW